MDCIITYQFEVNGTPKPLTFHSYEEKARNLKEEIAQEEKLSLHDYELILRYKNQTESFIPDDMDVTNGSHVIVSRRTIQGNAPSVRHTYSIFTSFPFYLLISLSSLCW